MISIKLTHGTHTVLSTGKTYSAGDVFPGTEAMLAGLTGKAVKVEAVIADDSKAKDGEVDLLRAELDELGVSYHGRSGVEKLKQQLEEAKANADQQAPAE